MGRVAVALELTEAEQVIAIGPKLAARIIAGWAERKVIR